MISFIVPTRNYGPYLKKCIYNILKNDRKFIKEIIIINNSSSDNTKDVCIKYFKKIYTFRYTIC